tara:strand:+ start:897 stop:1241 length:345 start_codon:yes stop_codon:yes gene_type:complete
MGKRKAARVALLRAGDTGSLEEEIENLTTVSENLQVLLRRETEKTVTLQSQIEILTADLTAAKEKNTILEDQLSAMAAKKTEAKAIIPKATKTASTKTPMATKKVTAKASAVGG